jgi:hypothetical protein
MRAAQWIHAAEIELSPENKMLEACPSLDDLIELIEGAETKLFALTVNGSYCHGDISVNEFLEKAHLTVFFKGEKIFTAERTAVQ